MHKSCAGACTSIAAHLPSGAHCVVRVVTSRRCRRALPLMQSEYPPDCDARRAFISGFDGSAGTAVVTTDAALLWTDGRYFLQVGAGCGCWLWVLGVVVGCWGGLDCLLGGACHSGAAVDRRPLVPAGVPPLLMWVWADLSLSVAKRPCRAAAGTGLHLYTALHCAADPSNVSRIAVFALPALPQAEQQLGPDWTLMRDSTPGVPPVGC